MTTVLAPPADIESAMHDDLLVRAQHNVQPDMFLSFHRRKMCSTQCDSAACATAKCCVSFLENDLLSFLLLVLLLSAPAKWSAENPSTRVPYTHTPDSGSGRIASSREHNNTFGGNCQKEKSSAMRRKHPTIETSTTTTTETSSKTRRKKMKNIYLASALLVRAYGSGDWWWWWCQW